MVVAELKIRQSVAKDHILPLDAQRGEAGRDMVPRFRHPTRSNIHWTRVPTARLGGRDGDSNSVRRSRLRRACSRRLLQNGYKSTGLLGLAMNLETSP